MAIKITDACINCGACEPECPNNAIYEGGADWKLADGTGFAKKTHHDLIKTPMGNHYNPFDTQNALSDSVYYIVPDKCTECIGFHEEPQCAAVCPVDCCVPDDQHPETKDFLEKKKLFLHDLLP